MPQRDVLLLIQGDESVRVTDPVTELVLITKLTSILADKVRNHSPFFQMMFHLFGHSVALLEIEHEEIKLLIDLLIVLIMSKKCCRAAFFADLSAVIFVE